MYEFNHAFIQFISKRSYGKLNTNLQIHTEEEKSNASEMFNSQNETIDPYDVVIPILL